MAPHKEFRYVCQGSATDPEIICFVGFLIISVISSPHCCKTWRTTMQKKADGHAIHKQTLMAFHSRKSLHSAKKSSREWTELQHRIVGTGTMKINLSNERLASQGSFDLSLPASLFSLIALGTSYMYDRMKVSRFFCSI